METCGTALEAFDGAVRAAQEGQVGHVEEEAVLHDARDALQRLVEIGGRGLRRNRGVQDVVALVRDVGLGLVLGAPQFGIRQQPGQPPAAP